MHANAVGVKVLHKPRSQRSWLASLSFFVIGDFFVETTNPGVSPIAESIEPVTTEECQEQLAATGSTRN